MPAFITKENVKMKPEDKYKIRERCVYCKFYRRNLRPPTGWGVCENPEANMYLIDKATIAELFGCMHWEDVLAERKK